MTDYAETNTNCCANTRIKISKRQGSIRLRIAFVGIAIVGTGAVEKGLKEESLKTAVEAKPLRTTIILTAMEQSAIKIKYLKQYERG